MPLRLISQQTLLEHEVVARLADALRTAIGWSHHGGVTRKLESVRFLAESFRRHLERMLDLEEHGGYLDQVAASHPHLRPQLGELRAQHEHFRLQIDTALTRLEQFDGAGQAELDSMLEEFSTLLDDIDRHNKQETQLLQDVMLHSTVSDEPTQQD